VVKTIAAHNTVAAHSFVEFPAAGFVIALPCFSFLFFNADRDDAGRTLPLQPHRSSIIPELAIRS